MIKHQFICYIIQIAPIHRIHDVRRHIPEGKERKQETRDTYRDSQIAKNGLFGQSGQLEEISPIFSKGPLIYYVRGHLYIT